MLQLIGQTAGEIWQLLKSEGRLNLSAITGRIKRPQTVVFMALGWLAREDKLEIAKTNRAVTVWLK